MDGIEFQQLVKTFQEVEALPQLPESSFRLVQACDAPEATLHDAELVIAGDPGLTAMVLRSASAARFAGFGGPPTTVSSAVMRLGLKALKATAMTHAFRSLIEQRHESDWYDARRLAAHSVFVAVAMQHLFEREFGGSKNDLEEVFAFGLLHDLGLVLLAHVAPGLYDEVWRFAEKKGISFEEAFHARFRESTTTIAWAAASAWRLPELFVEFLHLRATGGSENDLALAVETLGLAEKVTAQLGYAFEPWMDDCTECELSEEDKESLFGAFKENWQSASPMHERAA